jgi:ribose transport system permease protein
MQLAATKPDTGKSVKTSKLHQFTEFLARNPVMYSVIGLVVLSVIMMFVSDKFLTTANLSNVLRQVSINAIISVGMTIVILTGGIDLSVGAILALSMTTAAGAMLAGIPPVLAIAMALIVGILSGAINGVLVAYVGLPAIIVTLAMMEIPRGIALLYTGGYPMSGLPQSFAFWGRGNILGIETPIVIMLLVFLAAYLLLNKYPAGRYLYGIGGNEEAVRLSGIRMRHYKLLAYTLSGFTAALSGIVLCSRLMSGQPNAGVGFELDAIAAVVLGGTSIAGGRGHILGTLIGAVTLGVLNNGLNLMEVSPYTQRVVKGIIILLAIYASTVKRRD